MKWSLDLEGWGEYGLRSSGSRHQVESEHKLEWCAAVRMKKREEENEGHDWTRGQWGSPASDAAVLEQELREQSPAYLVICWDDPVNLMTYVTYVFQKVFAWDRHKAEHHMLEVHHSGRSVLVRETLERAEHYVHMLQKYRLQATLEKE